MKVTAKLSYSLLLAILCSCGGNKNPDRKKAAEDHFAFDAKSCDIFLNKKDSGYLIERYRKLRTDRIDTLDWPLDINCDRVLLMVDVSGTMFNKDMSVLKDGHVTSFFHFALERLLAYLKDKDILKNASQVTIKLFGSKPRGLDFDMEETKEINIPRGKLVIEESFYSSGNDKVEIEVKSYEKKVSFNLYDSINCSIKELIKPYIPGDKKERIVIEESPLLEDIITNASNMKQYEGGKKLIYLTDGYFRLNGNVDLKSDTKCTIEQLKEKFAYLHEKLPLDSSIQYIFFGMNTMDDLKFRDKLNGFYNWFLDSNKNDVQIINLR